MDNLNKIVLIEYLISEIDQLEGKNIYESYCDDLYKISDLNYNLTYSTFKQKFIIKITSMTKSDIIKFMHQEKFYGDVSLIESSLKKPLVSEDFESSLL